MNINECVMMLFALVAIASNLSATIGFLTTDFSDVLMD